MIDIRHRALRDGVANRLMVYGRWLMVYGFDLEKFPFGGGNMESPVVPVLRLDL